MARSLIPLVVLSLLAPAALASHGAGSCAAALSLGPIEVGTGDDDSTFYVDDRNALLGYGTYVYQESNGVFATGAGVHANLQRGGLPQFGFSGADICTDVGNYSPDQRLL